MRNKFNLYAVIVFLRSSLLGILMIGVIDSQNSLSAPALPSTSTNLPNATGELSAVSRTRNEDAAKTEKDEASARSEFRGAIVAAIASIVVAIIALLNSLKTAKLTARLNSIVNLQTDYDKDLRNRRIEQYQRLFAWMVNLPKYPKPEPLTVEGLRNLALAFRDWYFGGGGLLLSENEDPARFSESSRERYFDFQEGCKIVLQKIDGEWKFDGDPKNKDDLRLHFERDARWNPREDALIELAACALEKHVDRLPENVVKQLRSLASALRTSMTRDVLTRRSSFLSDDSQNIEK